MSDELKTRKAVVEVSRGLLSNVIANLSGALSKSHSAMGALDLLDTDPASYHLFCCVCFNDIQAAAADPQLAPWVKPQPRIRVGRRVLFLCSDCEDMQVEVLDKE